MRFIERLKQWLGLVTAPERSMTVAKMPETKCPLCQHNIDIAIGAMQEKPHEHDLGLCYFCGGVLMVNKKGALVPVTTARWATVPDHEKQCIASMKRLQDSKLPTEDLEI